MLRQRLEFNASRDELSYPPIPDATLFQNQRYGYEPAKEIHGWQWSTTFNRWSALVTMPDGWSGFTYPMV